MTDAEPDQEMISVHKDVYLSNKAIADGMRAAARYLRVERHKDFQAALTEVMDLITSEEQF